MRRSLIISIALHLAVAVFAFGAFWRHSADFTELPPAIPIDLVTIDEKTNIKAMKKIEEPKEVPPPEEKAATPEPEPQRTAALPPPPDVTPAPEPTPEPPAAEAPPEPEAAPEPVPSPEAAPKPEEKTPEAPKVTASAAPVKKPKPPTPAKKKEAFDASKISALLNKLPTKETPEKAGEETEVAAGPADVEGVGEANAMTMTEIDALRAQMQRCWSIPAGAADAENLQVKVHISLNPDGSLGSAPEVVGMPFSPSGYYQVAAEAALRAVRLCAPYTLPAEKYSSWRDINMTFDPSRMLGGG